MTVAINIGSDVLIGFSPYDLSKYMHYIIVWVS